MTDVVGLNQSLLIPCYKHAEKSERVASHLTVLLAIERSHCQKLDVIPPVAVSKILRHVNVSMPSAEKEM